VQKKKIFIIHPALAPYRVDLWNGLNRLFAMTLYFVNVNALEQTFNQDKLTSMLDFKPFQLLNGITTKKRAYRFVPFSKIKQNRPDVVLTYEYSQITIFTALWKQITRQKFRLYSTCDDSLDMASNCSGLRKIARNFIIKKLDGIIVINEEVASWYKTELNVTCFVLPIIYDQNQFNAKLQAALPDSVQLVKKYKLAGKKVVFSVGRLEQIKGIDILIDAFLKVTDITAVLAIIGTGSEVENLKNQVTQSGLQNSVIFLGKLEGEVLYAWYNIGQVFVLPSTFEPFGAVVSEALQSGARVLCSNIAGSSGLINQGNGKLFNPHSSDELADLLDRELSSVSGLNNTLVVRNSKLDISLSEKLNGLYDMLTV
jgi:glycosyltransferase involved in cell wall biosynthesis